MASNHPESVNLGHVVQHGHHLPLVSDHLLAPQAESLDADGISDVVNLDVDLPHIGQNGMFYKQTYNDRCNYWKTKGRSSRLVDRSGWCVDIPLPGYLGVL